MVLIILGVIVLLLGIVGIVFVSTYNKLIGFDNSIDEAFSTMDAYLVKRTDLIPNIVATIKGYAAHEANTLMSVIQARQGNLDTEGKIQVENKISQQIPQIMALSEKYPELKANQNYMQLTDQLGAIEGEISQARKYFNGTVKRYNDLVRKFPSNIIAGMFGHSTKTMFQANEGQRQNIKVSFD